MKKKKKITIGFQNFWNGFTLQTFLERHPYLLLKYQFLECENPDYIISSVFNTEKNNTKTPNSCNIFYTGENIEPDMNIFDFALSFSLTKDNNHYRLPCWVPRMYENGFHPTILLNKNRPTLELDIISYKFCNFVFRNKIELREKFFHALSSRKLVSAPGMSCNNTKPIGSRVADKLNYQRDFRFSIAFENECTPGYTTEKIVEAFISGTVPIYAGDPNISDDFNSDSFVDVKDFNNFEKTIDAIFDLENNKQKYIDTVNSPIFKENKLPDYALEDNIMAFFESFFY